MEHLEQRLFAVERTCHGLEVSVARMEERLAAHYAIEEAGQKSVMDKLNEMSAVVQPLQQSAWKQRGAASALGVVGGFVASALITLLRYWK